MKNKQILTATIVTSAFVLAACGTAVAPAAPTDQTTTTPATTSTTTPTDSTTAKPAGGMSMAPVTPPDLTADQQAQLDAGTTAHQPTTLTFTVVGGNFFYVPSEIKVKKGDTVNIVFQNSGGTHNLNIDEYNVKTKTIKTGESDTVQFVADKVGTFQYYCAIGSHRKMGQQGNLIVEE